MCLSDCWKAIRNVNGGIRDINSGIRDVYSFNVFLFSSIPFYFWTVISSTSIFRWLTVVYSTTLPEGTMVGTLCTLVWEGKLPISLILNSSWVWKNRFYTKDPKQLGDHTPTSQTLTLPEKSKQPEFLPPSLSSLIRKFVTYLYDCICFYEEISTIKTYIKNKVTELFYQSN